MDRRSIMSLLIGITLFLSTWHIMLQQQEQFIDAPFPTNNNFLMPSLSSMTNESAFSDSTSPSLSLDASIPKNDFSQLIDLNNFEFRMNTVTCKELDEVPLVVILVHSAPSNHNKRQTVRETWGGRDRRSILRFLIGNVNNNSSLEEEISLENQLYGDIVQGNFDDAYRNLTYKHVMVLKWFTYYCPNAKYLLKTDDDVLINTPLLYDVLESPTSRYSQLHQNRRIFCSLIKDVRVKRTFRSKWRVSFKEYPEKFYPSFCPGYVILYTSDIVPVIYQVAQKLPYFWIDDVHMTGTVAVKSNVTVESPRYSFLGTTSNLKDVRSDTKFLFSGPNVGDSEIRNAWKEILKGNRLDDGKVVGYDNEIFPK